MVQFNNLIKDNGQGLIEAIVALGAAVIVISTIAVAVITAVNNSDFSKNQNSASSYSQQGLEIMRDKAESNWTTFSNIASTTHCLNKDSTDLTPLINNSCTPFDVIFIRKIDIRQDDVGCRIGTGTGTKVKSIVSWTDGKCTDSNNKYCHEVKLESCMANINSVPSL